MGFRTSTGARRYNNRMDRIWKEARAAQKNPVNKSYRRHYQKLSRKKK